MCKYRSNKMLRQRGGDDVMMGVGVGGNKSPAVAANYQSGSHVKKFRWKRIVTKQFKVPVKNFL